MLRLSAGMPAARGLTGTVASGGMAAAAVRAVRTLVRLAGRIGVWSFPASITLPVSASTRIQAPGGGSGAGVVEAVTRRVGTVGAVVRANANGAVTTGPIAARSNTTSRGTA